MSEEEAIAELATLGRGVKIEWIGSGNDKHTYCAKCGAELQIAEKTAGFDVNTGERIVLRWKYCPTKAEASFLWWSWQVYICNNGTPEVWVT